MAAKVLFFGQDSRRCIPAFKRAGYSVDAYRSAVQMRPELVEDRDAAVVAVSGVWEPFRDDPISTVRNRTRIPFILFAEPGERSTPSIFDLVIPSHQRPSQWLIDLDRVIRKCQATCAEARKVVETSDLLIKQSGQERERSGQEWERTVRELSRSFVGFPGGRQPFEEPRGVADFFQAPAISAIRCEERDRLNWSIMIALATLTNHLWKIMRVRIDDGKPEQMEALQAEQERQAENLEALLEQWKAHRASHGC